MAEQRARGLRRFEEIGEILTENTLKIVGKYVEIPKREIQVGHDNASVQIEVDLCGRRKKWLTSRVNQVRR